MSKGQFVRALPEQVYEADKILRVEPQRLQRLGLYTIRIMLPPDADDYAVETPSAIRSAERIGEDRWHVDFTMYAPDNSGEIDDALGQFSDDGHMFLDNTGASRMQQFGDRILMGYFVGTIEKNPLMLHASAEIPEALRDLDFEPSRLLTV